MHNTSWNDLIYLIDGKDPGYRPVGFIVDSPWIPGWFGISRMDYYSSDELWIKSNLRIIETFPGVWFMPGFWSEYGMCTEPSAFGSRMIFNEYSLPHSERVIADISEWEKLPKPDVRTDGLLPFMIGRLKRSEGMIRDSGHQVRFAVARGPLNIASFLMGTTEFMLALAMDPVNSHHLLNRITDFICDWITWQKECFPSIDGVLILDDIIGFVGEDEFNEFVTPYFKRIFSCTAARARFLHNDAEGLITASKLGEMGVNIFNFSFNHSLKEIRDLAGPEIVLVGNIPPRDVLAAGGPGEVRDAVRKALGELEDHRRIIWSAGGGMAPDVPTANIQAFIEAVKNGI